MSLTPPSRCLIAPGPAPQAAAKAEPVAKSEPVAKTETVAKAEAVVRSQPTRTAAAAGRAKPVGPDWRTYGPMQVDWANWRAMGGSFVAPSLGSDMTKLTLKARVLRFLDRNLGKPN